MDKIKIATTTAFGIEAVAKRELQNFGIDAKALNGRLTFDGDLALVGRLNMFLGTCDRVYIVLGEFEAHNFDELFDKLSDIEFENYISTDGIINVSAKSVKSDLFAVTAITSISKKAIATRMMEKFHLNTLPETGVTHKIEVSIFENSVTVLLDTSGVPLYKRGYRKLSHEAPLKETLANAIVRLSVWNKEKTLIDCFCGSGTIPIEASLIGLNIAPGILRTFAFEDFKFVDKSIMENVRTEAQDRIDRTTKLSISGFDIDENSISLSMFHAKQIGVADKIHFQRQDMKDVKSSSRYGVIISNPPYGERLMSIGDVIKLYKDFARMFVTLKDFSAYIITAFPEFQRIIGLPISKERKLYNGNLECRLYQILGAKPTKRE
ncbi:MAG: class I SAM-dependent RNA methyltransferase [Clostridia bacterium]